MSTSNPSTTLTGGSSSTSTSTAASSQPNSNTATLYLFTFLATILILVLLSASLVLRSYILRRRYRQRFQQALSDGLLVDLDHSAFNDAGQFDALGGFRRSARRLGTKPLLWDTWIHSADRDDTWASITPVAVHSASSLSSSTLTSSPQPPTSALHSPSSFQAQAQSRPSLFSQLRFTNPFSLSFPASPLPGQAHAPVRSPTVSNARSPPPVQQGSPNKSTLVENDTAVLAVCVLVAMPNVSAPVNRQVPDAKGKGVDPLGSQPHQQNGDADPLLPSSIHRSGLRIPGLAVDEERLPFLEFGVVEVRTRDWIWKI